MSRWSLEELRRLVGEGWVRLDEVERALGTRFTVDELNEIMRTGQFEVLFNALDEAFYIRARQPTNGGAKARPTMQDIVNEARRRFKSPVPKPEFMEWLEETVGEGWRVVYERLVNDGVVEESIVSGMVLVRIVS